MLDGAAVLPALSSLLFLSTAGLCLQPLHHHNHMGNSTKIDGRGEEREAHSIRTHTDLFFSKWGNLPHWESFLSLTERDAKGQGTQQTFEIDPNGRNRSERY